MNKNIKQCIVAVLKMLVPLILFAIFYKIYAIRNIALNNMSRTAVTVASTFAVIWILMATIYGHFAIGQKKSKPIIYNTVLTIFFVDVITHLQLMIMNTNPNNNPTFRLEDLDILFLVFVLQVFFIILYTYFSNWVFFRLNPPHRTVLVTSDQTQTEAKVEHTLSRFKLQYDLMGSVDCCSKDLESAIANADYLVILEMDIADRKRVEALCYQYGKNFAFAPSITDVIEISGEDVTFDDKPMIHVDLEGLGLGDRFMKRVLDIIVSLIGIVIASPIFILSAIAIKAYDRGPVLFKQPRYTVNGKVFNVYKFRSMKENVENYSALGDDDRITPVGKVLRKIRMDELPQIFNILKGDMSVVGPRPEMIENVEKYEKEMPEFHYRLKVKAGLTGLAQIDGKYNTSPLDKLLMDLIYIENYSIWFDIKLIFRTITVFFKKDSTEGFEDKEKK